MLEVLLLAADAVLAVVWTLRSFCVTVRATVPSLPLTAERLGEGFDTASTRVVRDILLSDTEPLRFLSQPPPLILLLGANLSTRALFTVLLSTYM